MARDSKINLSDALSMSREQLLGAAQDGTLADEINPALALSTLATELLAAAARGELDLNGLAADTLADRGLDRNGRWVGFEAARADAEDAKLQLGVL